MRLIFETDTERRTLELNPDRCWGEIESNDLEFLSSGDAWQVLADLILGNKKTHGLTITRIENTTEGT